MLLYSVDNLLVDQNEAVETHCRRTASESEESCGYWASTTGVLSG